LNFQEFSMSSKYLIATVLATLLAGTASAQTATTDPVRARVVADLEQARKDGHFPPSEADYVYPNWVKIANPAGVVMTDGHPELENGKATRAARTVDNSAQSPVLMSDASSGAANAATTARTVKGGDFAQ
jgi:hypothetical protein